MLRKKSGGLVTAGDYNALVDVINANTICSGPGYKFSRNPSGTTLEIKSPSVQQKADFPFRVVIGPTNTTGSISTQSIGVISDSHVMDSTDDSTHELDNSGWGVLTDDAPDDDVGWIDVTTAELPIGSKIWLQFEFDTEGNLLGVSLEWGYVGNELWWNYPDPIEIETGASTYQKYYRVIIAEVTDPDQDPRDGLQLTYPDGSTKCQITQLLRSNLLLTNAATASYAQEPDLEIQVAIPWTAPGTKADGSADPITTEQDVMTPWKLGGSENLEFPFELSGNFDANAQGWIKISYGEVNEVAPTIWDDGYQRLMTSDDEPYEMSVSQDGVVYLAVIVDGNNDVVSFEFSLARDEESIPDDNLEEPDQNGNFSVNFVIGRFYIDWVNMEIVPFNFIRENIGYSSTYSVDSDGRLCTDFFRTYTREPIPNDYYKLDVYSLNADDTIDESHSSLFLSVGNVDDPDSDGLVFQKDHNYLQFHWTDVPEINLTDQDGDNSTLDTGSLVIEHVVEGVSQHAAGLHAGYLDIDNSKAFFGYSGSDSEYKVILNDGSTACGLHTDYLELDNSKVFLGVGSDNTGHLEISDGSAYVNLNGSVWLGKGGDNTWHLEISESSAYVELGESSEIFLGNGTGGWHLEIDDTGFVQVGDSKLSDGDIDLGGTGTITINSASYSPNNVTFFGQDGAKWTGTFLCTDPYSSGDTDDLWNLITDNVDDSIRVALSTLSATFTCNSDGTGGTITFSYTY